MGLQTMTMKGAKSEFKRYVTFDFMILHGASIKRSAKPKRRKSTIQFGSIILISCQVERLSFAAEGLDAMQNPCWAESLAGVRLFPEGNVKISLPR